MDPAYCPDTEYNSQKRCFHQRIEHCIISQGVQHSSDHHIWVESKDETWYTTV